MELYAGMHNRRIRTWNGGYRCPFCKVFWRMQEDGPHARGWAVGSFKQKYARRVEHDAYAEYLEKVKYRAGLLDEMWDRTMYA